LSMTPPAYDAGRIARPVDVNSGESDGFQRALEQGRGDGRLLNF
jgi:hypothetical protein